MTRSRIEIEENRNYIEEAQKKLIEFLPEPINALNEIIHDPKSKPKEIISASNALSKAERTLKRLQNGK